MRAVLAWSDKPPERDGIPNVCYDVCFRPDGSQLIAGVGNRVIIYDTATGEPIHTLKGHKDAIYCVAYSKDGKRFASGGADKTVIVWSSKAEGLVKYTHSDSIQSVSYNPATHQLASATAVDFGLWSPEEKSVAKHKVTAKILCVSWTHDGQFLALGLQDGTVRIHSKAGAEQIIIQHRDASPSPVWALTWAPTPEDNPTLAVGTWDGSLSFYSLSGQHVHRDRDIEFDPLCLSYNPHGDLLCVSGTDKKVAMYTKEGQRLTTLIERNSWIWSARYQGKLPNVGIGCEDGTVALYNVMFSTVHGLYQDRYAYRENITDVIVQHLITEAKVRIHCRDHVKRISVYKDKVAVQLPERVIVYELQNKDDPYDMQYKVSTKIHKKLDCNLLVLTSHHLVLCLERKFQMYTLEAELVREWQLESTIRYIKVLGGAPHREGLLVGLKSGEVLKIFVDNPFPISVLKHDAAIRCLDFSLSKSKLAVVDDASNITVYDVRTKGVLFQAPGANSVAWNGEFDDMLCYSGNGMLSIKTADFPVHQQKLTGFVVGFKGSKIFCLQYVSMTTIDVPQSTSMVRYLENKDYDKAFRVAKLGVTESDWRVLGREALLGLQLETALKCYVRVKDIRFIDKIHRLLHLRRLGRLPPDPLVLADVRAFLGQYRDAAEAYKRQGRLDLAMGIFLDLRQFEEAKRWAEELTRDQGDSEVVRDLMLRQAEWFEEAGDAAAAAEMYRTARKFDKAVALLVKYELWDPLADLCRGLPAREARTLGAAAEALRRGERHRDARDIYLKLGDFKSVAQLLVDSGQWDDAHELLRAHPEVKEVVMLPYATWLAMQDRFDEARVAYKAAGKPEESVAVLEQLAHNAVVESRFGDASFYFYHLAMESLGMVANPPSSMGSADRRALDRWADTYGRAELYYAYDFIHRCVEDPFTRTDKHTLFNISRYLLMRILQRTELQKKDAPLGISLVKIIKSLAKFSEELGAYKLARLAYQRLQSLKLPPEWQEEIELASIRIRTRPFSDAEDLQPVCYRCGAPNPLLNIHGDQCAQCHTEFVRSFQTFELLPVIEFHLDTDVSDQEALQLLEAEPPRNNNLRRAADRLRDMQDQHAREVTQGGAQMLRLEDDQDDREIAVGIEDPFVSQRDLRTITVGRETLRALSRSEVLIRTWPNKNIRPQYFRIMDRDQPVCLGPDGHFFEHDEYEMTCLEHGATPLSRTPVAADAELATMDRHYVDGEPVGGLDKDGQRTSSLPGANGAPGANKRDPYDASNGMPSSGALNNFLNSGNGGGGGGGGGGSRGASRRSSGAYGGSGGAPPLGEYGGGLGGWDTGPAPGPPPGIPSGRVRTSRVQ